MTAGRIASITHAWMAVTLMTSFAHAAEIPLELDLSTGHHIEAKVLPDAGYEIRTTGEDPYVMTRPLRRAYDPETHTILSFDYFCAEGLDSIQLFYGPPIAEANSARGPEVLASEGWTPYTLNILTHQEPNSWRGGYRQFRLDFGRRAGRVIQVRNLSLREPSAEDCAGAERAETRRQMAAAFDAELQSMVKARYGSRITRVAATETHLQITVEISADSDSLVFCEIPFYQSPADRQEFVWQVPLPAKTGSQTIEIDRWRGHHDRVFSSWILMRETPRGLAPASHPRFVERMPSRWTLTRDRPASRKGLPGINAGNALQIKDCTALGIRNATKNILLPVLVHAAPVKDGIPHGFNGTTVYIGSTQLAALDDSMKAMEGLKMVVSAIILIPQGTAMAHPDCAPEGIYAMANVVEEEGWTVYAAGLDFLAQRYLRPDRKYGRITHWIMHNEVDAGWVWTNAGEKPLASYLDLYYRSMRTAQSVIRRYGEAGQVLMSLTHYWTRRHNSRCYAPKDLIDLLAARCAVEGDFDWGLAYHPYPQNLRDPRTWLDKKVTFDFETPLITPKNLEILDAYMRQTQMLHADKVRTIVLSEQGSNSPDHSEDGYRNQAAGLVYTWLKLERLESIESYVHHRWMDHPKEGGLNLGMRRGAHAAGEAAREATATVCRELTTFGITCSPDATSKPAWEIYRVLETPEQSKAVDWAQTIIPSHYLKGVRLADSTQVDRGENGAKQP